MSAVLHTQHTQPDNKMLPVINRNALTGSVDISKLALNIELPGGSWGGCQGGRVV